MGRNEGCEDELAYRKTRDIELREFEHEDMGYENTL